MKKSAISEQNPQKGTGTQSWYRYPLYRGDLVPLLKIWVPVPIHQQRTGTSTDQSGTSTDASSNPVFVPLALLSLVFVHRLFRDPNKGLMRVQIRMKQSEKCTVPRYVGEERFVKCDNCLPTKSGVFMFD